MRSLAFDLSVITISFALRLLVEAESFPMFPDSFPFLFAESSEDFLRVTLSSAGDVDSIGILSGICGRAEGVEMGEFEEDVGHRLSRNDKTTVIINISKPVDARSDEQSQIRR